MPSMSSILLDLPCDADQPWPILLRALCLLLLALATAAAGPCPPSRHNAPRRRALGRLGDDRWDCSNQTMGLLQSNDWPHLLHSRLLATPLPGLSSSQAGLRGHTCCTRAVGAATVGIAPIKPLATLVALAPSGLLP